MKTYYVVTWDFEFEESGDVVKDGVVFTDLESAQKEMGNILFASIDADLSPRSKPTFSRRFNRFGYPTGEASLREIESEHIGKALQEVFAGGGQEITQ